MSLWNIFNENHVINGLNIGLINSNSSGGGGGTVNGVEVGVYNSGGTDLNTVFRRTVNGLQIGLHNKCRTEKGVIQIGLFNEIELSDGTIRRSIIFNYAFPKSS